MYGSTGLGSRYVVGTFSSDTLIKRGVYTTLYRCWIECRRGGGGGGGVDISGSAGGCNVKGAGGGGSSWKFSQNRFFSCF